MTHQFFDADKINWSAYLTSQQVGQGYRMSGRGNLEDEGNKEFFKGLRHVRGYGVGSTLKGALGSVGRFLLPIASNIIESAGHEADATLGRIGTDLVQGQPLMETLKAQSRRGLSNVGRKIQQCGKGKKLGRRSNKLKPKMIPYVGPQSTNISVPAFAHRPKLKKSNILKEISKFEISNNKKINPSFRSRKRGRDYLDLD
jgi:hypothetical protein